MYTYLTLKHRETHGYVVVVVTLFSNIIHEQNTSNTNLTNKAYPGYCKHALCWRPPEKALAYLAGSNNVVSTVATDALVLKHQAISIHNAD